MQSLSPMQPRTHRCHTLRCYWLSPRNHSAMRPPMPHTTLLARNKAHFLNMPSMPSQPSNRPTNGLTNTPTSLHQQALGKTQSGAPKLSNKSRHLPSPCDHRAMHPPMQSPPLLLHTTTPPRPLERNKKWHLQLLPPPIISGAPEIIKQLPTTSENE